MILSRAQFSQIVAFVLCLHVALLSLILFEQAPPPKKVVTKPLVVQTVTLTPKNSPAASSAPARLAAAEQPKPKPQAEKSASLPPAPKVAAAKPKPAAKPAAAKPKTTAAPEEKTVASAPVPNKALLAQAAESFAKMQAVKTPRKNEGANTEAAPVSSFKLAVEGVGTPAIVEADGYEQELAGRLQLQLRLPEYGLVEVKLTLKRDGSFVKVKIEKAESAKNRAYVEKRIPKVAFPPYNNRFKDDPHTFAITLCNE